MFTFLHAADLHQDSPLAGVERYGAAPVEELRRASRRAFENLVDLAVEEHVAFVVLAGDIYDGDWKDYNTGLFFIHQVARLKEHHMPVYMVAGSHDAANQFSKSLRLPGNMHRFSTSRSETFLLDEHGVALHGRGFATKAVSDNLAAASIGYSGQIQHRRPPQGLDGPVVKHVQDLLGAPDARLAHGQRSQQPAEGKGVLRPRTSRAAAVFERAATQADKGGPRLDGGDICR
jgi:hypothetical protein